MARQESDREDLYAELKRCEFRWELEVSQGAQPVVAGIKRVDTLVHGDQSNQHRLVDTLVHGDQSNQHRRVDTLVHGDQSNQHLPARELHLFLSPDQVYHFDAEHRLRRAYVAGALYRTQGETLARLIRVRTAAATTLSRHDLTASELPVFLDSMRQALRSFLSGLMASRILRQSPVDAPLSLLADVVTACLNEERLAPAIPTRRS